MKVICDVCGTTFADTATHCPICGCAKSPAAKTVAGDDVQASPETSTAGAYARGGRFAKNNVRRNSNARSGRFSDDRNRKNEPQQGNKGLIAVVIVLLLAIIMVVVYIGVNVFLKDLGGSVNNGGNNQSSSAYQDGDGNQGSQEIPCTAITLGRKVQEFTAETDQLLLSVELVPENTTDPVIFVSSDPSVATVDANGLIQPGTMQGEAIITVTCGDVTEECKIISTVGEAPEEPEPEIPEVVLPEGFVLKLETYKGSGEITISKEGGSHKLYKEIMGVKASDITWTSSDPAVATVEDGKVVGVDRGTCTITATIGDQTATCLVRCPFDAADPTPYALNIKDVTLYSDSGNKSVAYLELKEIATGAKMQVEWKVSKEGIVEVSDSGKVTACTVTSRTTVNVYAEYEGVTYTCIVRVEPKPAEE